MQIKILTLLLLVILLPVQAQSFKRIPAPTINHIDHTMISPDTQIKVYGQGFIAGLPNAHKASFSNGTERTRLEVIKANGDMLEIKIPETINLGDYELLVKIRTKLLRSRSTKANNKILLRPKAPTKPELKFQTIQNKEELESLLPEQHNIFYQLDDELNIGSNEVRAFYFQDSYQSLLSEPSRFFFLPELAVKSQLELESETPIKSYAINQFLNTRYDVSEATKQERENLAHHYYLSTPSRERYLEHSILLSPVYIEELRVTEPEYAIIYNRSSSDFDLTGCTLTDSVRERFQFDKQQISANSKYKLEINLGLNNSGTDQLELSCQGQILDKFIYNETDSNGLGIRIK